MKKVSELLTVEERVHFIVRRMARAKWRSTDDDRYAPMWGVTPSAVRKYAAEASRHFRVDPADRETKRNELAAWFRGVAERALMERNAVTNLPDFKAAQDAMNTYGEYIGVGPIVAEEARTEAPARIVIAFEDTPGSGNDPEPDEKK